MFRKRKYVAIYDTNQSSKGKPLDQEKVRVIMGTVFNFCLKKLDFSRKHACIWKKRNPSEGEMFRKYVQHQERNVI